MPAVSECQQLVKAHLRGLPIDYRGAVGRHDNYLELELDLGVDFDSTNTRDASLLL